jgi:LysM repeat protein
MSTPTPPAEGGSLVAKLGGPRNAAIVGAGGTVALVALLALRKGKSGASGTTTTVTGDTAFDSGPYDMWNQWQQEYEQLQQQVDAIGGGTTTATGPGTPKPPVQIPKPPVPPPAPKPPKPPVKPKPTPYKTVTVQRGDTLSKIAAKNHITMAQLKKLNPVYWTNKKYDNGNKIWSGDKVKV